MRCFHKFTIPNTVRKKGLEKIRAKNQQRYEALEVHFAAFVMCTILDNKK